MVYRHVDRQRLHQLLRRVLTLEDKSIVDSAGMDALILLRFCALCGRFCVRRGTSGPKGLPRRSAACGAWCWCPSTAARRVKKIGCDRAE